MVSGGAHAAQGFSIELGDPGDPLTLDWSAAGRLRRRKFDPTRPAGTSASEHRVPDETTLAATGDVVDDLGSLDKTKPVLWRESWELTLNRHVIFDIAGDIVTSTGEDIWQQFVDIFADFTGLPPGDLSVIIAFLEHRDPPTVFSTPPGDSTIYNTLISPCNLPLHD